MTTQPCTLHGVAYGRWLAEHVLTKPPTDEQIDAAARAFVIADDDET